MLIKPLPPPRSQFVRKNCKFESLCNWFFQFVILKKMLLLVCVRIYLHYDSYSYQISSYFDSSILGKFVHSHYVYVGIIFDHTYSIYLPHQSSSDRTDNNSSNDNNNTRYVNNTTSNDNKQQQRRQQ